MRHGQRDRARAAACQRLQRAIGPENEILHNVGNDALALAGRVTRLLYSGTDLGPRTLISVSFRSENAMKWILLSTCAVAISFATPTGAEAKGCIKGAIVGGVAGHMAGHGKLGAAAGCVIGHHEANKADANKANGQASSGQK